MKGRIYERRCDLSPDGRKFLYFSMNAKWESETGGTWTAVSKTPYLKALSLYAKGDCWHGGGLFLSDREFWLNDGDGHLELIEWGEIKKKPNAHPSQSFGGECPNVYYNRLQRDGWTMLDGDEQDKAIFEKKLPDSWVIRKLAHAESTIGAPPGRGCYWDSHELHHVFSGTRFDCPGWEWADLVDGRLVWATAGRLHAARLGKGKLLEEKVLHDFNDMKFERIAAPY